MKRVVVLLTLAFMSVLSQAHEFWLEPQKFFFAVGEKALINFKAGENFSGGRWDLNRHNVERLQLYNASGVTDHLSAVQKEGVNLELTLSNEGNQLIVMQSDNAFSSLEGDKFNEYLKEDGLDDIYDLRKKNGALNKQGTEFYSRHTKLLLQVGERRDDTFKKIVGLPIEIVPEKNPYLVKRSESIKFKILSEGKPLFGARVKVWNRHDGQIAIQNIYSQKDGTIEFPLSNAGSWMVSVMKMVPSKKDGAEWQSYWGSFVFGAEK
jgi:uncharacterized GH25 family protein